MLLPLGAAAVPRELFASIVVPKPMMLREQAGVVLEAPMLAVIGVGITRRPQPGPCWNGLGAYQRTGRRISPARMNVKEVYRS